MARRLLCDAVSFGFGPAGKLAAILGRLQKEDLETVLLASGTTLELAADAADRVIEANTEADEALEAHRDLFESSDLFLVVMNPISSRAAQRYRVPQVFVDSLFWMWDSIDPATARAERYCIQNFVGVEERLAEEAVDHPVLVGPIVDARAYGEREETNQLIVNFGGMESGLIRHGINLTYPFVVGEGVARALADHSFDRVLLTGRRPVLEELAERHPIPRSSFGSLAPPNFMEEVRRSKMVMTSPGLTATYECFAAGVPVVFLPPQNYSQVFNLASLRQVGAAPRSLAWSDLFPEREVAPRIPEKAGVEAVLGLIAEFSASAGARRTFTSWFGEQTVLDAATRRQIAARQRAFFERLGGDGARAVADQVHRLLDGSPPR